MTQTSSDLKLWAGITLALILVAAALAFATPLINPSQKAGTAWRYQFGRITLDFSPWTLDVSRRYRPGSVAQVLDGWSSVGRSLARWLHLTLDVVFPLAYAVTLGMAISLDSRQLRINPSVTAVLVTLPFVTAVADWLENAMIVWLSGRSRVPPAVATTLWVDSSVKWVLLITSVAVSIVLWIATRLSS